MSELQMQAGAAAGAARHTHYVSLHNNTIHPAMTYPPGFQDANPKDWRPATHAEIERYKAGKDALEVLPLAFGTPGEASVASPKTLQLSDDEPVVPVTPPAPSIPEAPVLEPAIAAAPISPPSPAPVIEPATVNPLPPPPPGA